MGREDRIRKRVMKEVKTELEKPLDDWVYENWKINPCNIDGKPGFKCQNAIQHFFIPCDLLVYIMGEWQKASNLIEGGIE